MSRPVGYKGTRHSRYQHRWNSIPISFDNNYVRYLPAMVGGDCSLGS